jgi:hypothetical protein
MRNRRNVGIVLAITSGVLGTIAGRQAHAQLLIEGKPDAIHVEVRDVPLRGVLDAMQTKFNLRYRSNDALDTPVTGTFDGSLQHVAARALDGYDFAITITSDGIDVLVLRQSDGDSKAVVAALPAKAPARSRAPVMTAQEANRYERGLTR